MKKNIVLLFYLLFVPCLQASDENGLMNKKMGVADQVDIESIKEDFLDVFLKSIRKNTPFEAATFDRFIPFIHADSRVFKMSGMYNDTSYIALALCEGKTELVEFLLAHGMDINAPGANVIHKVVKINNIEALRFLIRNGADLEVIDSPWPARTPLLTATYYGSYECLQELLNNKVNVHARAIGGGNTALHLACDSNYIKSFDEEKKIIAALLSAGLPINAQNEHNETVLHILAARKKLKLFKFIIAQGGDVAIRGYNGGTLLHKMLSSCDFDAPNGEEDNLFWINFLIDQGLDVQAVDNSGNTVLHTINYFKYGYINKLVQAGVAIDARNNTGKTPFLSTHGKDFIEHGADVNAIDHNGNTIGHILAGCYDEMRCDRCYVSLEHFAKKGLNLKARNVCGKTIYDIALARHGKKKCAFVDYAKEQSEDMDNALSIAVDRNSLQEVRELLAQGASKNFKNVSGDTPLISAVKKKFLDIAHELINAMQANELNVEGKNNCTALHHAAHLGYEEIVKALIVKGANINIGNNSCDKPLYIASYKNHSEIVKFLITYGAYKDGFGSDDGSTAVHAAAYTNSKEALQVLIDEGADLNIKTVYGMTALHLAAYKNYHAPVQMLIDAGAHLNIKDKEGYTPLDRSVLCNHLDISKKLIAGILADHERSLVKHTDKTTHRSLVDY